MSKSETNPAEALTPYQKMWKTRRETPNTPGDWLRKIKEEQEVVSHAIDEALGEPSPPDVGRVLCALARHQTTYFYEQGKSYYGYHGMLTEELEKDPPKGSGLPEVAFFPMNKRYFLIQWKRREGPSAGAVTYWTLTYRGYTGLRYYDYYEWKRLYETKEIERTEFEDKIRIALGLPAFGKMKLASVGEKDAKLEPVNVRPKS